MRLNRRLLGLAFAVAASIGIAAPAGASLTATIIAQIQAHYRGSNDLGAPSFDLNMALQPALQLDNGTSTNQANVIFADTRTLGASANETLDLYGALTDPLGGTVNLTKAKVILIKAAVGNTNNVVVGNATAFAQLGFDAGTDTWSIPPGGIFLVSAPQAGWTVTNTTADGLKVANSGGTTTVTYDIIVIGTQ